jgi:hypothetical protein
MVMNFQILSTNFQHVRKIYDGSEKGHLYLLFTNSIFLLKTQWIPGKIHSSSVLHFPPVAVNQPLYRQPPVHSLSISCHWLGLGSFLHLCPMTSFLVIWLHNQTHSWTYILQPWRWRQNVPSKYWYLPTKQQFPNFNCTAAYHHKNTN